MMTDKIPSSVDYKYWLKRLYTQLNESTIKIFEKDPKVAEPMKKKTLLKL